MVFSRRAAQSWSCCRTDAGATETSSPILANEAISAPPRAKPQAGMFSEASTANIKFNLTAVLRITSPQSSAAVRVGVTRVLLNYRRLRKDGQRLRCDNRHSTLSNRNNCGPVQGALHKDV